MVRGLILIAAAATLGLAAAAHADKAADRDARAMVAKFDTNGDGRLSYTEFPCQSDDKGECIWALQSFRVEIYDRNRDGFITAGEIVATDAIYSKSNDQKPAATGKD